MRINSPINGKLQLHTQHPILFQGEMGEIFRISILEKDIIRIQHLPFGKPTLTKTWSILGYHYDHLPELSFEGRLRDDYSVFSLPEFEQRLGKNHLHINTDVLSLKIRKNDFQLTWSNNQDQVFASDREISPYPYDIETKAVYHYMHRIEEEFYYGFGERAGPINKKGRRMRMFNIDALGYDAEKSDPLYKHFPVYITFNPALNIAYGLIYDNLSTTIFDMGCEIDNYHQPYHYYQAEFGDIDYYLIYGPSIPEVVEKISVLTGKMALPPKWSLGYLGSTMSYTDAPNAQEELQKFRELCYLHKIPCDLFHLSSGYSMSDSGNRFVFKWNKNRVPDPNKMVEYFHDGGIKLAANIKPALLTNHPDYDSLTKKKAFIQKADQNDPVLSDFWGGKGAHLDFTNPETISWWKNQVRKNILDYGIDGTWNDNNEYPILDDQARCFGFGDQTPIGLIRPLQSLLMTKSSRTAQLEHKPNLRPFLLCRSGCPGIQRYAQTWTGDNYTSWNTLKFNIPMGLGMSLSGAPNTGHDVGGFTGEKPDPELFIRWVQNGIFHPRFTIHSWNTDGSVNEPWMHPEVLPIIRDMINFRYQLIPFFYSLFFEAARSGAPIIRPLVYHFPNDPKCWEESFDFMLGEHLLIASVFEPGKQTREVYLPSGDNWYDFYSGILFKGGQTINVDTPLEKIPLFVRNGGIIPTGKTMQYIGEQTDNLRKILIFPHQHVGTGTFRLVEDDGISLNYQRGEFTELLFSIEAKREIIGISLKYLTQNYDLPYRDIEFVLPKNENRAISIKQNFSSWIKNGQRHIKINLD